MAPLPNDDRVIKPLTQLAGLRSQNRIQRATGDVTLNIAKPGTFKQLPVFFQTSFLALSANQHIERLQLCGYRASLVVS
jgi:hypothetical protein